MNGPIVSCVTCGVRFTDSDNSGVGPCGHEPPDDDWPVSQVTI